MRTLSQLPRALQGRGSLLGDRGGGVGGISPFLSPHSPVLAPGAAQLTLVGSKREFHPSGCQSVQLAALSKEARGTDNTKQQRIAKCI